ncbi:RNA chaperone [Shewanella phage vB_SspS_KASIA]|nr:RNA chaperone [Shewanella phage vB_SspS_KASIA]
MKNNQYRVYKSNIDKLIELYPDIFNKKAPKPLAIGLYQQLAMDVQVTLTNTVLRSVLMIWTNRFEYLREVIKPNAVRYNLDGSIQGEVSVEHRLAAIQRQHNNRLASKMARRKRIQLEEERVSEIDKAAIREILFK